ncbi:MAG: hypothetical protein P1T08_13970, partial [Acidimicrobiia bacterium]|nr:hypothetical protein [Acidimicrobiia bacterium]
TTSIQTQPKVRNFDEQPWGISASGVSPAVRVFVDDRAELYGGEFFERVAKVRLGALAWRAAQEEWDIQQALLDKTDGLVGTLEAEGWVEVFSDDFFVVLRSDRPREPGPITP